MKPKDIQKNRPNFGQKTAWSFGGLLIGVALTVLFQNCTIGPGTPTQTTKRSNSTRAITAAPRDSTERGHSPWGKIRYSNLALSRASDAKDFPEIANPSPAKWIFSTSPADLTNLVHALDLPAATRQFLLSPANWDKAHPGRITVYPSPSLILGLPQDARARLYAELGKLPENKQHHWPFRFRLDGMEEWFQDCELSPERFLLARNLVYTNAGTLAFSDLPAFIEVTSVHEARELVKCLSRVSTFTMKVELNSKKDAQEILSYWKLPGVAQPYAPFFESMGRSGESQVNIILLLPPFARLRLYTFPSPLDSNATKQNCVWSALNFENAVPDDGFFNEEYVQQKMRSDYVRLQEPPLQFGDLVVFHLKNGMFIHMCVYLADDVVFTKNGTTTNQPWQLMKLEEVIALYSSQGELHSRGYRKIRKG